MDCIFLIRAVVCPKKNLFEGLSNCVVIFSRLDQCCADCAHAAHVCSSGLHLDLPDAETKEEKTCRVKRILRASEEEGNG